MVAGEASRKEERNKADQPKRVFSQIKTSKKTKQKPF